MYDRSFATGGTILAPQPTPSFPVRLSRLMSMRHGSLKLKAQILCGDTIAMGPGKADLLEAIDRAGSISAAGRLLGMSYRRTWVLVDEMNRCWSSRLVQTERGGGGGASLSDEGRRVLAAYRSLEAEIDAAVARTEAFASLDKAVLAEPLQASSG